MSDSMKMKADYGGGKKGNLHEGLKTKNPSVDDSSRKIKGGHVNDGATRSEPSKADTTIGPRNA
jgi:hypothetical protein